MLEVIPERVYKGAPDGGLIMGYSDNYLNVVFAGNKDMIGKVCQVTVTEAGVNECQGELVQVLDRLPVSSPSAHAETSTLLPVS
jgi:threonylcarbamoyladenosine tRNA methylthiotransferase MtaB